MPLFASYTSLIQADEDMFITCDTYSYTAPIHMQFISPEFPQFPLAGSHMHLQSLNILPILLDYLLHNFVHLAFFSSNPSWISAHFNRKSYLSVLK